MEDKSRFEDDRHVCRQIVDLLNDANQKLDYIIENFSDWVSGGRGGIV